jgi:hypothetical protein
VEILLTSNPQKQILNKFTSQFKSDVRSKKIKIYLDYFRIIDIGKGER